MDELWVVAQLVMGAALTGLVLYHQLMRRRELNRVDDLEGRIKALEDGLIRLEASEETRKELKQEVNKLSELVTLLRIQLGARNRE